MIKIKYYKSFSLFLFVLLIVAISDDTIFFGTNSNLIFINFKYIFLVSLCLLLVIDEFFIKKTKHKNFALALCIVMCINIIATMLYHSDFRGGYPYKVALLFSAYIITKRISFERFSIAYEKIIYTIALVSVVTFPLGYFFPQIISVLPVISNTVGTTFYNLVFNVLPTSSSLMRNYGIFREPGVYQMFLITSALLYLHNAEVLSVKRLIVYYFAIIFTFSTTGYISLALLTLLILLKNKINPKNNIDKILIKTAIMILIMYLLSFTNILSLDGPVFDKLFDTKRYTTIARFSSITSNYNIWCHYPLIGAGINLVDKMFPELTFLSYGLYYTHNTNTFMIELASFGIIYGVLLAYGFYKLAGRLSEGFASKLVIFTIFMVLSSGEKLVYSLILYILMFYGIMSVNLRSTLQHTKY